MSVLVGTRVVRGPDWEWDDQDYGEGHVGTVISIGQGQLADRPEKTVMIMWDRGRRNNYRAGFNNRFDLRIFDNAPTGTVHQDVSCSSCSQEGIRGVRWKCFRCFNYNLCMPCFMNGSHEIGHDFQRFVTTKSAGTHLYNRSRSQQIDAKGIFPGAQVQRGNDWKYGDQDGGDGSRPGHVVDIRGWHDNGNRAAVGVRWARKMSDKMYRYRVGYEGKVDIKCVKVGYGGPYYPDLLPSLGENDGVRVGDTIILNLTKDTIKSTQQLLQPNAELMSDMKGVIKEVTGMGEVDVEFQNGQSKRINPVAVQKVAAFKVGDKVKVINDQARVEKLQHGHGGWNSSMSRVVGKGGKIEQVYSDGDVKVRTEGVRLLFNPACVELVSSDSQGEKFEQNHEDGLRSLTDVMGSLGVKTDVGILGLQTDESEKRRLSKAAALGRVAEIHEILRSRPDWIDSTYSGRTPLQVAAHQGQLQTTQELMKYRPALEVKDSDGDTALLYATYGNKPEVMQYLIDKCCYINVLNRQRRSCLHVAARRGHIKCVELLLKAGCNCNIQDKAGDLALHDAIHKDKREVIKYLVEWPQSDLNIRNNRGMSPLHYAAHRGTTYAADCLISHYPRLVRALTNDGLTPLHVAAKNNFRDVASILITKGKCSLDDLDNYHLTPLLIAVQGGYADMIELLVKHGANVNAHDGDGDTPLHAAVLRVKHSTSGKEMLAFRQHCVGVDDAVLKMPGAPLLVFLIQQGASICLPNNAGKTPLDLLENPSLERELTQIAALPKKPSAEGYIHAEDSVSQVMNLKYGEQHEYNSIVEPKDAAAPQRKQIIQERPLPKPPGLAQDQVQGQGQGMPDADRAGPPFMAWTGPTSPPPQPVRKHDPVEHPAVKTAFEGVHRIKVEEVTLLECIGKGSFAEVHKGRWRGTIVAVKKMALAGSRQSEVEQEVAIHKQAMHPNIVQLMALGYDKVFAFLVMNYINGLTLHAAIFPVNGKCELTMQEKNMIAKDILSALTFMHASGLLHLDIKPTNVLLEKVTLKPYLCDLGLSHLKRRAEMALSSHVGFARGTPMYMAPELHEVETGSSVKVSGAQDVWSMACTLLEVFGECSVYPPTLTMWGLARLHMSGKIVPESLGKVGQPHRDMLKPCFDVKPKKRPSADYLLGRFTELCGDSTGGNLH